MTPLPEKDEFHARRIEIDSIPLWTPIRVELLGWFQQTAPSLAPAYEGAVELVGNQQFPGRVHFVAHAVRDIADRLVFALDPQLEGKRVQYHNHLDEIQKNWSLDESLFDANGAVPVRDNISISWKVARLINRLVVEHRGRRQRPSHYELLFQWLMRNHPSRLIVNRRIVNNFTEMREWFMKLTHLRSDAPLQVNEQEFQQQFAIFEKTLHGFVGSFFTGVRELDEILQQANQ